LFVVGVLYQITVGLQSPVDFLELLVERVVVVPMADTYKHYWVFPDLHPHLNFSGSKILNLFLTGGRAMPAGREAAYKIASFYTTGVAFNMNTGFLGDCWAQFGYIGVVEGALLIFGVFLFWDIYFLRRGFRIPVVALVAFFLSKPADMLEGGLLYMLIGHGSILAPICYLLLFEGGRRRGRVDGSRPFRRGEVIGSDYMNGVRMSR
jgi:hypothetical protein